MRSVSWAISVFLGSLVAWGAQAEVQPAADAAALPAFFAGSWTLQGREQSFTETCGWLEPNSYLICNGSDTVGEQTIRWVTLLGYDPVSQTYQLHGFNGSGGKVLYSGWLRGTVWIFTGNQVVGTDTIRTQMTMTPSAEGYRLLEETSVNGAPWSVSLDEVHLRVEPPAP